MRATILVIFFGLLSWTLTACGAPPTRPDPGRAPAALLLQIDGLSPALLKRYFARPQSLAADRGLRRLVAPRGAVIGEALAPLPSTPEGGGAALLTTPQGTLFEAVGGGLSVGLGQPKGASAVNPSGDAARIKAAREALGSERLIALRLTGLVEAMSAGGLKAGLPALAAMDKQLKPLVDALPPYTLVVLTAAHGAVDLSNKTARDKGAFAKFLKVDEARLEPHDGLLFVKDCDAKIQAQLGGMPFVRRLYTLDDEGALLRFDANASVNRPAAAGPLQAPIKAALSARAGACMAVAHRAEGYAFQISGEDAGKIGFGGPDSARVPLIIAGPIAPTRLSEPAPLSEAPALIAAFLGAPTASTLQPHVSPTLEIRGVPEALRARPALAKWLATPPYRAARLQAQEATPIPEARALPFKLDVREAAAVAGFLELEVISFGKEILSTTPFIARFGGPAYFVGRASPEGVAALSALARADRHVAEGLPPLALKELSAVKPEALPEAARPWAGVLRAFTARMSPKEGDGEHPAWPALDAEHPAAAFAALLEGIAPHEGEAPWLRLKGVEAAPYRHLPGWVNAAGFCEQDYAALEARRLAAAEALKGDFPGLAAQILSAYVSTGDVAKRRATTQATLKLLEDPRAAWRREQVLAGALNRFLFTQGLSAQMPDLHRRLARAHLLRIQAEVLADPHPDRNQARLGALLAGAASVEPELQEETIALAVGDEGNLSIALLRGVLSQGGLLSFLNPQFFQRLARVRQTVAAALAPVLAKPVDQLTAEERLTRALLSQLDALLGALQGQLPLAEAKLKEAAALLEHPSFEAAYQAALRLPEGADAPPTAWGRASLALTRVGLGVVAIINKDKAGARPHLEAGVEILRGMSQGLLAKHKLEALGGHVDALAALLKAGVALVELGQSPASDAQIIDGVFKVAAGIKLDIPKGEAEAAGRWMVLAGLILRDALWAVDVFAREGKANAAILDGTAEAWSALRAGWSPESRVGQALLSASELVQGLLPQLPKLKGLEAEGWLEVLTTVEAKELRALLTHNLDDAKLKAKLRAGEVEWAFIHLLRKLLDLNLSTLKDKESVIAFLDGELRALVALTGEDAAGPVLPAIAYVEASMMKGTAAAEWADKGARWSKGTAFDEAPFLWDLLAWERAEDAARLAKIVAACPALAPDVALAQATLAARAGRRADALARLSKARRAARRQGGAHPTAKLSFNLAEGETIVTSTVDYPVFNALLGARKGTFQVGAGASTNPEGMGVMGLKWTVGPTADARDFAIHTLTLEILLGLEGGDEAMVDRALSRLSALFFGLDPRWLDPQDPDESLLWLPPQPPKLRSPLTLAWLATIAELRGHDKLGRWLLSQVIGQVKQGGWPDEETQVYELCKGKDAADDETPPLLAHLGCNAPQWITRGWAAPQREALAALMRAHLEGLMLGHPPKDWAKRLKAASKAAPKLLPGWVLALDKVKATNTPLKKAPKYVIEALAARRGEAVEVYPEGYQCDLALARLEAGDQRDPARRATLLKAVAPCGPVPFKLQAYFEAGLTGRGAEAYQWIEPALRAVYKHAHLAKNRPAIWAQAKRIVFDDAWRIPRLDKIAAQVKLAQALGDEGEALWWKTAGLILGNATPQAAAELLSAAEAAGVQQPSALRFLARYAYGPKAGYRAAAQAFFSGR